MRILAIRGENLASLAERFELDFETGPLRDCGLFAITGETGAGKSTLLDALCLALYDAFPRVAAPGATEDGPDASGNLLAATDARAILRRGAGRGFAEADFVARDGRRYRARCDLARARGRPDGNLQKRGRALFRIDEAGEVVASVASGVEPVREKIVELTDLTFEQFRRTVLLAQGEFDAFLRASADERASLLEKITGASIYAEISRRVFDEAKAAAQAVARLEEDRAALGLLSEEELTALRAQDAALQARRLALRQARQSLFDDLKRRERFDEALKKRSEAASAHEAAQAFAKGLNAARERLAALDRAEPLRPLFNDRRRESRALAQAERDMRAAVAEVEAAHSLQGACAAAEAQAAAEVAQTRAALDAAAPQWREAERLDALIDAQRREESGACGESERADAAACARRSEADAASAETAKSRARAEAAQREFAQASPAKPVAERWDEVARWIEERRRAAAALAGQAERAEGRRGDGVQAERRLVAFARQDAEAKTEIDALRRGREERENALAALDEAAAQRRAALLDRLLREADFLRRAGKSYDSAAGLCETAAANEAGTQGELTRAQARLTELTRERALILARREETERLGELADAAASELARRLRASLVDGEACPVCGASNHPLADDAHRDAFVTTLRERRADLRDKLARTGETIDETTGSIAALTAGAAQSRRAFEEASRAMTAAAQDYSAGLKQWRGDLALPDQPAGAAAAIATAVEAMTLEREQLSLRLDRARDLAAEIERLRKRRDELIDAAQAREVERGTHTAILNAARGEVIELEANMKILAAQIANADACLSPYLAALDLAPADLDRDAELARQRMRAAADAYLVAQRRAAEGVEALLEAERTEAETRLAAQSAQAGAEAARAALKGRRDDLEALLVRRRAFFNGDSVETVRAKAHHALDAQAAAYEATRKERESARMSVSSLEALLEEKRRAEAASRLARDASARALDEALAALALPYEDAEALLDTDPTRREAEREEVASAERALERAAQTLADRDRDLAEASALEAPEVEASALRERLGAADQQLDEVADLVGQSVARLAAEERARQEAQEMALALDDRRHHARLWAEISDAVGSASGDKFRRFAQGITLERLIGLANLRLESLAPRYRLERGQGEGGELGLSIVDRELCDEKRSTRSLSGGERFLTSLALALALAGLEGRDSFVDTLFIDEGFGALDAATLDIAIDALETLQGHGRKVGVISHVEQLHQRIATQIRVEKRGAGKSVVRLPVFEAFAP